MVDHFKILFKCFTILGVNPKGRTIFYSLIYAVHFVLFAVGPLVARAFYYWEVDDDFSELIVSSNKTCVEILTIVYISHLFTKVDKYEKLCDLLREEKFDLSWYGDLLVESFQMKIKSLKRDVKTRGDKSIFVLFASLTFITSLVTFYHYWLILLKPVDFIYEADKEKMIVRDESFFRSYHFLDFEAPLGYFLENLYTGYTTTYFITLFYVTDLLLIVIFVTFAGKLEVLDETIKLIKIPKGDKRGQEILGRIVEETQRLLAINDFLNDIAGNLLFAHHFLHIYPACTYLCLLETDLTGELFLSCSMVVIMCTLHPYMIINQSQMVINKFEQISLTIYGIEGWQKCDKNFIVTMQIILAKFQRPVILTMANFIPHNLECYKNFLKLCYNFYFILRGAMVFQRD